MLKSKINICNPIPKLCHYPCLKEINSLNGFDQRVHYIVLFVAPDEGTVLYYYPDHYDGTKTIGMYSSCFVEDKFTPFKGEVNIRDFS